MPIRAESSVLVDLTTRESPENVATDVEFMHSPQPINEEAFSEISLDPDAQDNLSGDNSSIYKEEPKNPLLDLDSSSSSSINTSVANSAFNQVTNQASQFSAQLSQLPSVASSVFSSFSSILGRGSSSNNQPKEPEVYRSPLDNLLTQNQGVANSPSYPPANQVAGLNPDPTRPPSNPVEAPPPIPLYSAGQVPSNTNQKPLPGSGNAFRLGGIKKKTYAQIPGLSTSHVSQLPDTQLQSNPSLPASAPAQNTNPNYFSPQPPHSNVNQQSSNAPAVNKQVVDKGFPSAPLPANFFQPANNLPPSTNFPQPVAASTAQKFTPQSPATFAPDLFNPLSAPSSVVQDQQPNTAFYSNLPPQQSSAPVVSTNLPSLPPSNLVVSSVSSNFPPSSVSFFTPPVVPTAPVLSNPPSARSTPPVLNVNQPSANSSVFAPPVNAQVPSSFSANPPPANVSFFSVNPLIANQPPSALTQLPPTSTPPVASTNLPPPVASTNLPPPPTASKLFSADPSLPPVNQAGNRNPFSLNSGAKNRASITAVPPASENISVFTPTFFNPGQSNQEVKNSPQIPPTSGIYNPQQFNPYPPQANLQGPPQVANFASTNVDNQTKTINEVSPYLTISPESEQSVLRSLTPVNSAKPSTNTDSNIANLNRNVDLAKNQLNISNFLPTNSQNTNIAHPSQDNSRRSSTSSNASSYFLQKALNEGNDLLNQQFPEVNSNTSSLNINSAQSQSFFTTGASTSTSVGQNFSAPRDREQLPSQNSQISNLPTSTFLTGPSSIGSNKPASFPSTKLGNMENNASNEPMVYQPVSHHWFHKKEVDSKTIWTPFSLIDSAALEKAFNAGGNNIVVATDGGRYDVNISERSRTPVYWPGEVTNVRRCSWFFKAIDSRFMPYEENIADLLETEYRNCADLNTWHHRIELPQGEAVMLHGPKVLVHFLRSSDNTEPWSNGSQTANRPRVVKRGIEEFEIDNGEPTKVDHLLFLVHGIGSVCDLKFRTVEEVVDEFRGISLQLVQSHYRSACEQGVVNRIEVLPVSWHGSLHSSETGIDDKLKAITLESIPKLREFTNGTLLDVLFYTSPVFCQNIMHTVGNELNRLYALFLQRNPGYNGGVSLGGHSLGSLILFDLLCHQNPPQDAAKQNSSNDAEMDTQEEDKVAPLNEHKPLKRALSKRINFVIGHAGTGQPFIKYPQLSFHPNTFFALGSPLGMFVTIRGIDTLGLDFTLPTCPGFFNIFHPYDPVAYRVEALVNPALKNVRPVLIPHHKGRKRMHLELKETMSRVGADLKNRLMDSVKNTWNSVYQIAMFKGTQTLDDVVDKALRQELQMKYSSNSSLDSDGDGKVDENPDETTLPLGKLNQGRRVDYVLQEAPLEFFNEYLFALTSHVCYWESEDTMLIIIKEIYSSLGASTDSQIPQQTMTIERSIYTQEENPSVQPTTSHDTNSMFITGSSNTNFKK